MSASRPSLSTLVESRSLMNLVIRAISKGIQKVTARAEAHEYFGRGAWGMQGNVDGGHDAHVLT